MACMTHECNKCEAMWFDNKPRGKCPECGSWEVCHTYDEPEGDYDEEEEDEN